MEWFNTKTGRGGNGAVDIQMPEYRVLVILHCAVVFSHFHFLFSFPLYLGVGVKNLRGSAQERNLRWYPEPGDIRRLQTLRSFGFPS